jgi:hypothetical protein
MTHRETKLELGRPQDLQTVLTSLSLDSGQCLWDRTGLTLSEADARRVVGIARTMLARLENGSDTPYDIDYSVERVRALADDFSEGLRGSLDRDSTSKLVDWIGRLIRARSERDWYQGLIACLQLANDPLKGHVTLLIDPSDREHLLRLITQQLQNPDDQELIRRSRVPTGASDEILFERYSATGLPTDSLQQLLLKVRYEAFVALIPQTLSTTGARSFMGWLSDRINTLNSAADAR